MTYEEFYELAALYALEVLDQKDRRLVEEYLAEFPEDESKLEELRDAVDFLPYAAPQVPIASDLKDRLFERIADESKAWDHIPLAFAGIDSNLPFFSVRASELQWQPHPVPGVAIAKLHEDRIKREIICLLRAQPGVRFPTHRHGGTEEIFMLEGNLVINGEVFGPGDYIRSNPGSIHSPHTFNGCQLFLRTSLDNEILSLV
jgi:hypothetical protein